MSHSPTVISASAQNLQWPAFCACCMGKAETVYQAKFFRRLPTKVVLVGLDFRAVPQSKRFAWDVPYCERCLHHAEVMQQAERVRMKGIKQPLAVVFVGLLISAFIWAVLFGNRASALRASLVCLVAVGVTIFFAWLWRVISRNNYISLAGKAEENLSRRCCRELPAVHYQGYTGTVHTFAFFNEDYAKAFSQANAKKLR